MPRTTMSHCMSHAVPLDRFCKKAVRSTLQANCRNPVNSRLTSITHTHLPVPAKGLNPGLQPVSKPACLQVAVQVEVKTAGQVGRQRGVNWQRLQLLPELVMQGAELRIVGVWENQGLTCKLVKRHVTRSIAMLLCAVSFGEVIHPALLHCQV